jgi:transcriptional regulator with XRE-family HTH domain
MLRVKEICKEKGITMLDLAKRIGITYQALYSSVAGNPALSTLEKIASALDVEVAELFKENRAPSEGNRGDFTAFIDHGGKLYRFDSLGALKFFIHHL